jgi:hypothetical protein
MRRKRREGYGKEVMEEKETWEKLDKNEGE